MGFNDFMMWGVSSDDLIRQAQLGDTKAILELRKRGENIPPVGDPAGRFGQHGRPGGPPVPVLGMDRPAYLDRGISRDMGRPAADAADQPPPLPFMSAINARPQGGPELGMNLGQGDGQSGPVADDPISRIAHGNDAAAAIQAGAAQADADVGASDDSDGRVLPGPIGEMAHALDTGENDTAGYGGMIGDIIKQLQSSGGHEKNVNMALAEAGFGAAASGNPFFFGAVGQGGLAGLKSYRESEQRDMENSVRAAGLGQKELERGEEIKSHRTQEDLEQQRNTETVNENQRVQGRFGRTQAEEERHNKAAEADNRAARALQAQGNTIQAGQLLESRRQFEVIDDRYRRGEATETEYKKAQADYMKAQAGATKALEIDRMTDLVTDDSGFRQKVNKDTGIASPVLDDQGNKVKAQPKGGLTALQKNTKYYVDIGLFPDEKTAASAQQRGKTMAPDRRLVESYKMADGWLATQPTLFGDDAATARENMAQQYYESLGGDAPPSTAGTTPSAAAPSADEPPVAGAKKAPNGNWYVPDPARPGKYLQVQ